MTVFEVVTMQKEEEHHLDTKNHELVRTAVADLVPQAIDTLKSYVRIPSVAAQNKGIPEAVKFVVEQLKEAGGEARVLSDLGGNPVIYGYFPAGKNGASDKTLLFYNHYDVQPPEPFDEWKTEPFEATEIDGILYGRGVADNKADLIVRLTAIQALRESEGGLPCNVKFMIEGEEEVGSPNLLPYLEKYAELFAADACIWEFGNKDEKERVSMVAGIKGMAYMELICESADIDLHSSMGAYVDNAAWRLVHALTSMKNEKNEIVVEGFYDDIIPPTAEQMKVVESLPFEEGALKEMNGLKRPLITEALGKDPRIAMVFEPTMTICGLESGYYGEGSKTVLPKRAMAKVDCRLVPGQDPEKVVQSIRRHLDKHGYSDVEVRALNCQRAYRSDFSHPFIAQVVDTAKEAYGAEIIMAPNHAGTGPMYDMGNLLKLPIVSTGVGWANSKVHAPNESIRLNDFEQGTVHMAYLLKSFGQQEN